MVHSRALKHERGQTLAEFAIIVPVLLLLLVGIFDLGRAIYAYSVVANSAREGARYGLISTHSSGDIIAKVKSTAVGLDPADITVGIASDAENKTITVDVIYLFHPITPIISHILHGNLALHSASIMYTGY